MLAVIAWRGREKKRIKKKREREEGASQRRRPVTMQSEMRFLSLFAARFASVLTDRPPRPFRFLLDRVRTQGDLDRTDAMAQNGSAGIINHRP